MGIHSWARLTIASLLVYLIFVFTYSKLIFKFDFLSDFRFLILKYHSYKLQNILRNSYLLLSDNVDNSSREKKVLTTTPPTMNLSYTIINNSLKILLLICIL